MYGVDNEVNNDERETWMNTHGQGLVSRKRGNSVQ